MRPVSRGRRVFAASTLALLTALSAREAAASGFFLLEESARLQGTAYAGTAALAADASTVYYNPAGMSRIKDWSFAQSGYLVALNSELQDATATNFGQPVFGKNGATSAGLSTTSPVGATMLAKRLTDDIVVGFAFTVPFGLTTQYGGSSIARFTATKSRLATYNLSPTISYELFDGFSIGAAFDATHADVALNQKVQFPGQDELNVRLYATDWTFGWNAGALWEIDENSRIGIAYRSKLTFGLNGTAQVTPNALIAANQNASATTTFPDTWTLSGVTNVAPRWQLLGDLQWVHWSVLQNVDVKFQEKGSSHGQPVLPETVLPFGFRSTFRGAIGTQYFYDADWTFRGGVEFDQSPVTDSNRTARLPDSNRILVSVGVGYQIMKEMSVDLAYSHIFQPWEATINQPGTGTTLTGHYDSSADLVGIQLTFTFDNGLPYLGI